MKSMRLTPLMLALAATLSMPMMAGGMMGPGMQGQ